MFVVSARLTDNVICCLGNLGLLDREHRCEFPLHEETLRRFAECFPAIAIGDKKDVCLVLADQFVLILLALTLFHKDRAIFLLTYR